MLRLVRYVFSCGSSSFSPSTEAKDSIRSTDEDFNSIIQVGSPKREEKSQIQGRPIATWNTSAKPSQVLDDIIEEPGPEIEMQSVYSQEPPPLGQLPAISCQRCSSSAIPPIFLSRSASAGLPDRSCHYEHKIDIQRTATEPVILITSRSKRRSPRGCPKPGLSFSRRRSANSTLSPQPLVQMLSPSTSVHGSINVNVSRLIVTPSMELRLAAASKIREIAAMYAEKARISRERGAQSLKEAEEERERKRARSKLIPLQTASSLKLELLRDRSNPARKRGITSHSLKIDARRSVASKSTDFGVWKMDNEDSSSHNTGASQKLIELDQLKS